MNIYVFPVTVVIEGVFAVRARDVAEAARRAAEVSAEVIVENMRVDDLTAHHGDVPTPADTVLGN